MIKPKCFISNIFSQINSNGSSVRGCHSEDKGSRVNFYHVGIPIKKSKCLTNYFRQKKTLFHQDHLMKFHPSPLKMTSSPIK
jgi:hypothetical protein